MYSTAFKTFKNDFLGPIGSYDLHFIGGAPPTTKDYLTLIRPFQPHVWAFVIASVMAVSMTLTFINKLCSIVSNKPEKDIPFQSINKIKTEFK